MAHTYTKIYYHLVWSTKKRQPLIQPSFQIRLYNYMGGIVKHLGANLINIGGMNDHVHLLIFTPPDILLADIVRQVKSRSTKWINKEIPQDARFAWQDGYGGFSVSFSQLEIINNYIKNQEQHHKTMSFQDEYLTFLKLNKINVESNFTFDN
ncbi:MAG: IS200/IS605 family transposase [Parachlamydiaceae bacterium]|nr:IS200/IS605 family transposase [Parachlamydiaceae bacterium]